MAITLNGKRNMKSRKSWEDENIIEETVKIRYTMSKFTNRDPWGKIRVAAMTQKKVSPPKKGAIPIIILLMKSFFS